MRVSSSDVFGSVSDPNPDSNFDDILTSILILIQSGA